ncbi:MAG: RraA family protein [Firmicutes bacterium]|nr:RraA family protein [Bacillota bacterium]
MWNEELRERVMKTDPAAYGHLPGVRFMAPEVKPVDPSMKVCGPAYTCKIYGKDSYAMYKAIEEAPAGSVIVIDKSGDKTYAPVGEFVVRGAKLRGLAGIVLDGPATDSVQMRTMPEFPVFCAGLSCVTSSVWGLMGDSNIDVSCGGAAVHPGDIILGDADGVVVIPAEHLEEMLEKAEALAAKEAGWREAFLSGSGVNPLRTVSHLTETNILAIIESIRDGKFDDPRFLK